jgi:zona occludens toxin
MPIQLVTGLPGHGKTLYVLSKYLEVAGKEGRAVYYAGIKDLKLPWQEHDPEQWEALPPNSIFVIDEAQFKFPVRGRGQPPEWIERLAVHRHLGLDFVLITQNPMLIDVFVRRLCDRHFHVVRAFGLQRATVYEYVNGVHDAVARTRVAAGSIRHEWRYPARVFELYHSAEVHTVKRRVPARLWLLVVLPVLALAAAWFAVVRLSPNHAREVAEAAAASAPGGAAPAGSGRPVGGSSPVGSGSSSSQRDRLTVAEYLEAHRPRVAGLAYTASVYDDVTKPTQAPWPAACVQSATRCQCYTAQATRLDVPADLCARIAGGGFFVAWAGPVAAVAAAKGSPAAELH